MAGLGQESSIRIKKPLKGNNTMRTESLKVSGMTCEDCTRKVALALKAIAGVEHVEVSLSSGEAAVNFDDRLTSPDQLNAAVVRAGFRSGAKVAAHAHHGKGGCCG